MVLIISTQVLCINFGVVRRTQKKIRPCAYAGRVHIEYRAAEQRLLRAERAVCCVIYYSTLIRSGSATHKDTRREGHSSFMPHPPAVNTRPPTDILFITCPPSCAVVFFFRSQKPGWVSLPKPTPLLSSIHKLDPVSLPFLS